jgi:hypothetical protein
MSSWARATLRVFGALHLTMTVLGLGMIVLTLATGLPGQLRLASTPPYFLAFFLAGTVVSLFCLVLLGAAGAALVRCDPRGVRRSNVALVLEVIWVLVSGLAGSLLIMAGEPWKSVGASEIVASGTGDSGLAIQVLTGYPLIALTAINLASRRERRASRA